MRNLTDEEIKVLGEPYDKDDEWVAIESTVQELADLGVGTLCGTMGNRCFQELSESGCSSKKVRGWYHKMHKFVEGMFHVECDNTDDAMKIEEIAHEGEGSLREEGQSKWPGFWEFEIE